MHEWQNPRRPPLRLGSFHRLGAPVLVSPQGICFAGCKGWLSDSSGLKLQFASVDQLFLLFVRQYSCSNLNQCLSHVSHKATSFAVAGFFCLSTSRGFPSNRLEVEEYHKPMSQASQRLNSTSQRLPCPRSI